ncbi:MAG: winged helix-turn-helix transcriptional regulator [Clostridia bacterium]|nr:winged helix-turn-helix transcriptional regulator [Clostridia bacterium]
MENRFATFTILMTKINRFIRKIKTIEMAEFDLKSPHVSCLYYLYVAKSLTAKELCDLCDEDKASISRSIEYLEKNEYITCSSSQKKRYKSPLTLTEKGVNVAKKIVVIIDKMLEKASIGVTDEERHIMYKSLSTICDNLQSVCDNYID